MKPSQTRATTGCLSSRLAKASAVATTSGEVLAPRTISSSFMILAGLKKCRPMTSCGRAVAAAIRSMSKFEVLEAKMTPFAMIRSRSAKRLFFASRSSNIALDHQIGAGGGCEGGGARDPRQTLLGLGRAQPSLGDIAGDLPADQLHRAVSCRLRYLDQGDRHAPLGEGKTMPRPMVPPPTTATVPILRGGRSGGTSGTRRAARSAKKR